MFIHLWRSVLLSPRSTSAPLRDFREPVGWGGVAYVEARKDICILYIYKSEYSDANSINKYSIYFHEVI